MSNKKTALELEANVSGIQGKAYLRNNRAGARLSEAETSSKASNSRAVLVKQAHIVR